MEKNEKNDFVQAFRGEVTAAPLVALAEYRGATVAQTNALRRTLAQASMSFQVVKNTLAAKAIEETPLEPLTPLFKGMTAVILSGDDPVAAAKFLREKLVKDHPVQLKAGFFDGAVQTADEVRAVADLPSREDLLAMLLRAIQAGPRQVLGVLQGPARDLLYLLRNLEQKLEAAEQGS